MSNKTLVVIGSGPGIGTATAALFATHGFTHVALLARNAERLSSDAARVRSAASSATVDTYPVDVGDETALDSTLKRVASQSGAPEVVLFNAARIQPSTIGAEPTAAVLDDFKVMNIGLYVVLRWAAPHLEAAAARGRSTAPWPCFFLSGGAVHEDPLPSVFSLCMQKAAQHNLLRSYEKTVAEKGLGVHVGIANIGGVVSDDHPQRNAKAIAELYWELYNEDKSHWRFEVDVGVQRDDKNVRGRAIS